MNKLITEFIGTFFLILVIGLTVNLANPLAALAIGSALMVMVYMGGHISGAHYNPAVTLGLAIEGAIEWGDAIKYWVVQILAGIVAGAAISMLSGSALAVAPNAEFSTGAHILNEFLFTFSLVLVVLNVAVSDKTKGNSFYGLAIGFAVFIGAAAGGGISGGAYNPAVGLGPNLWQMISGDASGLSTVWIYLVGPLLGGVAAAAVYKMQKD